MWQEKTQVAPGMRRVEAYGLCGTVHGNVGEFEGAGRFAPGLAGHADPSGEARGWANLGGCRADQGTVGDADSCRVRGRCWTGSLQCWLDQKRSVNSMHPNRFTSTRGRRKATTKPAAASVPFRAADHLRNAKEIIGCSHCLGAFDLPAAQCDASTGPRPLCWLDRPDYSIFAIERSQCQT
jgi:hypothetical protein